MDSLIFWVVVVAVTVLASYTLRHSDKSGIASSIWTVSSFVGLVGYALGVFFLYPLLYGIGVLGTLAWEATESLAVYLAKLAFTPVVPVETRSDLQLNYWKNKTL